MARPEAVSQAQIGQAKPGQNGGSLTALARPGMVKSQSQAVRPRLSRAKEGNFFCKFMIYIIIKLYIIYQLCMDTPAVVSHLRRHRPTLAPHPHIRTSLSTFFFAQVHVQCM